MARILTKETTLKKQQDELGVESNFLNKISPKIMYSGIALFVIGLILKIFWKDADIIYIIGALAAFIGFGQKMKAKNNVDDIRKMKAGRKGEDMVLNQIQNRLNDYYYVLNDCTIQGSSGKAQIDHLIISDTGIFVVETKNYMGKIEGSAAANKVLQTKQNKNGSIEKISLSNPVSQNEYHCKILKEFLKIYKIEIDESLIKSIIIFANNYTEVIITDVNENAYVGKIFDSIQYITDFRSPLSIQDSVIISLLKALLKDFDESQLHQNAVTQ